MTVTCRGKGADGATPLGVVRAGVLSAPALRGTYLDLNEHVSRAVNEIGLEQWIQSQVGRSCVAAHAADAIGLTELIAV